MRFSYSDGVRSVLLLFLVAAASACPWDDVSVVDEGQLCFTEEVGEIRVRVTAPDCLSANCSRDRGGSCSATVEGTRIELTSEIHWEEHRARGLCTKDCGDASVECTIGALDDGSYTVVLGDDEVERRLAVPVDESCPF